MPIDDANSAPRIRRASIPDDAWLVVRGLASIEPETSIRQADSSVGASQLGAGMDCRRSMPDPMMDVVEAGFEVVPTYRSPHVTITFYNDLEEGIARLMAVDHRVVSNPAYRREEP